MAGRLDNLSSGPPDRSLESVPNNTQEKGSEGENAMEKQPIDAPLMLHQAWTLWSTRKAHHRAKVQVRAAAKAAAASTEPQTDSTPS